MSFVSDFGKSISNKTKEISQKAKVMSETSSLNNIIKGEECKIDFQYKAIGKMYFEKYGNDPGEEFSDAIGIIKSSLEKIEQTKEEIIKVKSRFNCPACGEPFKNNAMFCSKCGAKLPEREEQSTENTAIPENAQKCGKCGNILKKEAIFCNVCGNKLTQQAAVDVKPDEVIKPEEFAPAPQVTEIKEESPAAVTAPETTASAAAPVVTETAKLQESAEPQESNPVENTSGETGEKAEYKTEAKPAEEKAETKPEKICPNCNNRMLDEDIFCNECGTKVG
ncbi:MAG: zinc-ribbon domain-containing protein [Porcipelethomonas sp.]